MMKMASKTTSEAKALEIENARLETELKDLEIEINNLKSTLRSKSSNSHNTTPNDFTSPPQSRRMTKNNIEFPSKVVDEKEDYLGMFGSFEIYTYRSHI